MHMHFSAPVGQPEAFFFFFFFFLVVVPEKALNEKQKSIKLCCEH